MGNEHQLCLIAHQWLGTVEVCGSICVHGTAFFFVVLMNIKYRRKEVVQQVDENGVPQV